MSPTSKTAPQLGDQNVGHRQILTGEKLIFLLLLTLIQLATIPLKSQPVSPLNQILKLPGQDSPELTPLGPTTQLHLNKITGDLELFGNSAQPTYQVYFILPIAIREQAPMWLEIDCPEMIDYRFVRLDQFNVFVAARINNSPDTIHLDWTSWVLTKRHNYSGIPASVPMPSLEDLPDSVLPYLMPTACVQWEDTFVKHIADSIRGTTNDLITLAADINDYSYSIPWTLPVQPYSWDAYYAMKWGNTCVGHVHAAAAIFRANGIPCRVLMCAPTWYINKFDMHWLIEYFVPQYGWVKMEPSLGKNPYLSAHSEIVTFACRPEDEFSLTFPDNIESYWFTSDTVFQHQYPNWGMGHFATLHRYITDSTSRIDSVVALTDSVYRYFTRFQGIELNSTQLDGFQTAKDFQFRAYDHIKAGLKDSLIYYLNQSFLAYRSIPSNPLQDIFFDDFESGANGWSHGGINDEWEIGSPSNVGPPDAFSGSTCWGTDLDSLYSNNADCWLLSPAIDLSNLASADLSVKIWNDVEDDLQGYSPKDKLWIEASIDNGANYFPITTHLGGVIDNQTGVPQGGGWSRLVLDLTPYVDETIRLRFRFTSNGSIGRPGTYIDDVRVSGRLESIVGVDETVNRTLQVNCYPNPSSGTLTVEIMENAGKSRISVVNVNGQIVLQTQTSRSKTQLDLSDLPSGVYVVTVEAADGIAVKRVVMQ